MSHNGFAGFAVDVSDPNRILVVDILVDDLVFTTLHADRHLPELALQDAGESDRGFTFSLPDAVIRDADLVEARLANLDQAVGAPVRLDRPFETRTKRTGPGAVNWLGGLHVRGWTSDAESTALSVLVDGVLVERVRPTVWRQDGLEGEHAAPVRTFTLHLPAEYADGRVHYCAVLTQRKEELQGSPLAFMAIADGLRSAIIGRGTSERDLLRAELFDRLVPVTIPFSSYDGWRATEPSGDEGVGDARCAVVLIGSKAAAADTLQSLRGQTRADWIAVTLPARGGPTGFDARSLRRVLHGEAADCPVLVFALAGSILNASALHAMAAAFGTVPEAQIVYADVNMQEADGSLWPLALPAFDYERMLEQGYCMLFFAMGRDAAQRSLEAGASDLPRLFNAVLDASPDAARAVVHRPGAYATLPSFDLVAASGTLALSSIAHLKQRGISATPARAVGGVLPAVRIVRAHVGPTTTIIIPTRNRRDLLEACMQSIMPAVHRHGADIVIVDNGSSDADTLDYLRHLQAQGVEVTVVGGPFNFARLVNRGARVARGELLCLLNNDIVALDDNWLDELMSRMADGSVGAVAPLLVWPSDIVQHGGIVLGPKFEAAHAFTDRLAGDSGYADLLRVAHEVSALTAACLLTRRRGYLDLGGMDEQHFPINYNDVDYCLKLREAGRRVVFTPHAKLVHAESSSRGHRWSADRRALFERERRSLRLKWGGVIADDPYYSPLLSLDPQPYSGLAASIRSRTPRVNRAPVACEVPAGF